MNTLRIALVHVLALASLATGGCYVEAGTDFDPIDAGPEEVPGVDYDTCDKNTCLMFCGDAYHCAFEEGTSESACINDCLATCGDGWADDDDLAVMACARENDVDLYCDDGLLESCCARFDGTSDFCE
jgi:hypothetical protein